MVMDAYKAATLLVTELEKTYEGWEGTRQFLGTANRVKRLYEEFCWEPSRIASELEKQLKHFKDGYNEMLVISPIDLWVLCPHHLLPCHFNVAIGYIPSGRVLGISKFVRIAEIMGKRPIIQEEYSRELADFIQDNLEPKGVAVYVVGQHGCMVSRGVRSESSVATSVILGAFDEPAVRAEFFALARG
jgi:GTP cyclohydrolase I